MNTLSHSLSALAIQLEGLRLIRDSRPIEARLMLDCLLETTHRGLVETRRANRELCASPPSRSSGKPSPCATWASRPPSGGCPDLELAIRERFDLQPEVKQGLFHIAEEFLVTVSQNPSAHRVSVRLEQCGDSAIFSVRDDGCRFNFFHLTVYTVRNMAASSASRGQRQTRQRVSGGNTRRSPNSSTPADKSERSFYLIRVNSIVLDSI
jgi:signal transduction histidine kinase